MEFAGNDFIYLSKLKKSKIKKKKNSFVLKFRNAIKSISQYTNISKAPKTNRKNNNQTDNKSEKTIEKNEIDSEDSDKEEYLSVNSKNFDINLENSKENNPKNENSAPGTTYRKAIDTNVCVIKYNTLENESETILDLNKCIKCNSYLNKHSILKPLSDYIYEWKCEFCFNKNYLQIEDKNLPKNECFEKCIIEPEIKKEKEDDTSLIFCLDNSGSMSHSYYIDDEIKEKFKKVRGENLENKISRLKMVILSIENIINSLLKKSPQVKVGLVTFESAIEVKGDCLSNSIEINKNYLYDKPKLESFGKENTNLIKSPINESSEKIMKSLREIKDKGCTALGPAALLSLSLLNNAKIGSRIFLCTDGESNKGIGNIDENEENAKLFYTNLGNMAKEKGIVISLISFEDSESSINILKNMIEISGGDIFRVNPKYILDDVNDFLENRVIASDVEIKMNLNRCLTFRDEEKENMINDGSTIIKNIGNVTKEKETYFELKFKHSKNLEEISEINFDKLSNLIFQCEINYKKRDGGKYIRIITKRLKVSDNKEEINKQANLNIVSTLQIQKSAKLASKGKLKDAQAQIHVARNFLNNNIKYNNNNIEIYDKFNFNMNDFHEDLNNMNNEMNYDSYDMDNMNKNNLNYNLNMNIDDKYDTDNMNNNNIDYNLNMNNDDSYDRKNCNYDFDINKNNDNYKTNNVNIKNDKFNGQIYALSNISQNRQDMKFKRSNKNKN